MHNINAHLFFKPFVVGDFLLVNVVNRIRCFLLKKQQDSAHVNTNTVSNVT